MFSERARRPPPLGRIDQGIPKVPLEPTSDPGFPRHEQHKNNEIPPQIPPYLPNTTDISRRKRQQFIAYRNSSQAEMTMFARAVLRVAVVQT